MDTVVDFGPNNNAVQVQNSVDKLTDILRTGFQDGTAALKTSGIQIGTTATTAVYAGGGTSASPLTSDSETANFMEFRFRNTAATGDIRGMYLRTYYAGGAGGEALRAFSTIEAATGTAHGAHISLSYGSSPGATSGLACAIRGTLHIADRATSIGTAAAIQAEVFCDGTSSAATGTLSLMRFIVDGGDSTSQNTVDYFFTAATLGTNIFGNQSSWAVAKSLKVQVNGTDYWLALSTAA